jgi:hypothetical protein
LQEKDAQLAAKEADKHVEEFNADTNRIKALADAFSKGLQVSVSADGGINATPLVSQHPLNKPPPQPMPPEAMENEPTEPASAGFSLPAEG